MISIHRGIVTIALLLVGCTAPSGREAASRPSVSAAAPASGSDVVLASHAAQENPAPAVAPLPVPQSNAAPEDDAFAGQAELSLEVLVAKVQARNPSLQAASEAWRAATERYPQVVSLDDPMFAAMVSPTGLGMDEAGGWNVQASQKLPWHGKRALRGSAAAAEADAMLGDVGEARLRLAEAARLALADYYLAARQSEVNASTQKLMAQFREIALTKYQVGQAPQQDVLQADVELAQLAVRQTELSRDRQIAAARINTLLHEPADCPLPPPPKELPAAAPPAPVEVLQESALCTRPDLYGLLARIRAEEANLALACREYYPDVNLVARYDAMMDVDMRPQVGMDINVPLHNARRAAAVREAASRVAQRRAEYQDRVDQVRYEVQTAFSRATQAAEVVRIYREKTLPAAERSLESAQAGYTAGNLDFLRLLEAQRQLNEQRERYYMAVAEQHRRAAELDRAVGRGQ